MDKATEAEALAGTADNKWMTPAKVKKVVEENKVFNIGGSLAKLGSNTLYSPTSALLSVTQLAPVISANGRCGKYLIYFAATFNHITDKVTVTIYLTNTENGVQYLSYTSVVSRPTNAVSGTDYDQYVARHNAYIDNWPPARDTQFAAWIQGKLRVMTITENPSTGAPIISIMKTYSSYEYPPSSYARVIFGKTRFGVMESSYAKVYYAAYSETSLSKYGLVPSINPAKGSYRFSSSDDYIICPTQNTNTIDLYYMNMLDGSNGSKKIAANWSSYEEYGGEYIFRDDLRDLIIFIGKQAFASTTHNIAIIKGLNVIYSGVFDLGAVVSLSSAGIVENAEKKAIFVCPKYLLLYDERGTVELRTPTNPAIAANSSKSFSFTNDYMVIPYMIKAGYAVCDLFFDIQGLLSEFPVTVASCGSSRLLALSTLPGNKLWFLRGATNTDGLLDSQAYVVEYDLGKNPRQVYKEGI